MANNKDPVLGAVTTDFMVSLAIQHILSAARFSREVGVLESQHARKQLGMASFGEIVHPAVACIMTSVASLEAYANELFFNGATLFPEYSAELMRDLWETYEQKQILKKFEFALLLLRKPPMDRGTVIYENVSTLIRLRNALTHFKPEWMSEAEEHAKLAKQLDKKIVGSQFIPADEPLFPRRWATHSCTIWSVKSVLTFTEHFDQLAGVWPRLKSHQIDDPPL